MQNGSSSGQQNTSGGQQRQQSFSSQQHTAASSGPSTPKPDGIPSSDSSFEVDTVVEEASTSTSDKERSATSAKGTQSGKQAQRARSAAWMRAALNRTLRSERLENGWKRIQMQLGEDKGTMTVKARRDADGVAVSVNFSDTALRAQASAQASQLQEALEQQYETDVDFSLMQDGDSGPSQDESEAGPAERNALSERTPAEDGETSDDAASSSRSRSTGATREWIG